MPYKDKDRNREWQREWIQRRRDVWFSGKFCVGCGSDENLELDHKERIEKVTHRIWSWSQERRDVELAKCQILCKSCHGDKTRKELRELHFIERVHGTVEKYNQGCRCDYCTEALRNRWREIRLVNRKLGYSDNKDRRNFIPL